MALEDLSEIERKTYEIIEETGEIQPKNLPEPRMIGAVSNLRAKGLVIIFKKYELGPQRARFQGYHLFSFLTEENSKVFSKKQKNP